MYSVQQSFNGPRYQANDCSRVDVLRFAKQRLADVLHFAVADCKVERILWRSFPPLYPDRADLAIQIFRENRWKRFGTLAKICQGIPTW